MAVWETHSCCEKGGSNTHTYNSHSFHTHLVQDDSTSLCYNEISQEAAGLASYLGDSVLRQSADLMTQRSLFLAKPKETYKRETGRERCIVILVVFLYLWITAGPFILPAANRQEGETCCDSPSHRQIGKKANKSTASHEYKITSIILSLSLSSKTVLTVSRSMTALTPWTADQSIFRDANAHCPPVVTMRPCNKLIWQWLTNGVEWFWLSVFAGDSIFSLWIQRSCLSSCQRKAEQIFQCYA